MTVKIVTDSTSDITRALADQLGVTVVPLTVMFGHETFLDRVDITTDEFYRRLTRQEVYPTTTQPSPGAFAEIYKKLAAETDGILVIVISGKLSGTYQSASSARDIAGIKARIEVIDSTKTAMALGLLVIAAAKMAKSGASLDDIAKAVRERIPHTHPIMAFDTLKYLAKGGRIGRAQGLVGSVLRVRPVLTMRDGEVAPLTRLRSQAATMDYLYNAVASLKDIEELAVEHATTPDDADALVERLSQIYPKERIYRSTVSPVLGTYMGPNVLSISYMEGK